MEIQLLFKKWDLFWLCLKWTDLNTDCTHNQRNWLELKIVLTFALFSCPFWRSLDSSSTLALFVRPWSQLSKLAESLFSSASYGLEFSPWINMNAPWAWQNSILVQDLWNFVDPDLSHINEFQLRKIKKSHFLAVLLIVYTICQKLVDEALKFSVNY